jgi:hypothetical protein
MDRSTIVGAEHDYDSLITSVGAEPPPQQHYGPPPPYYPQHQQQHHPQHHGHGHHPQHHAPVHYVHAPPPQYASLPPQQQYASPPPQQMMVQAPQHVVLAAPQRHIVHETPVKARDFPIGFMSAGDIVPNSPPVEIEVKPQALFKGRRLSVAHSIAKNFVIVDIKVGTNPQQGATGEMPAESFSSNAVDTRMQFDTASPGTTITIRVRNISSTPSPFMATLFGDVLV